VSALAWAPGARRIHRIVGWTTGAGGGPDFQTPAACVEQRSDAPAHSGCSPARGWPALESDSDPFPAFGSLAVSGDGRYVYVSAFNAILVLGRDPGTGALEQLPGTDGCVARMPSTRPGCAGGRGIRGASELALSPDGRNLYVVSRGPATSGVAAFARDGESGALTQLGGDEGCLSTGLAGCARGRQVTQPQDVVVAPDGTHVYVVSANDTERGGGVATLDRDPEGGRLTQRAGSRGCSNERGSSGCARDRRIGSRGQVAIEPRGRALYSIGLDRGEGPRVSPIRADGSIRRSSPVRPFPNVAAGLAALAIDATGRVYARWDNGGLFVYAPSRRSPGLHLTRCWTTEFAIAPCRRADAIGGPTFQFVVPAADGKRTYINNDNGIAVAEFR
jgi:hypothetical protein